MSTVKLMEELSKMREELKKEIEYKKIRDQVKKDIYKKEYKRQIIEELKANGNLGYYFVTINPKECEIFDLEIMISKIRNKKWMNMKYYNFEQRGETDDERGKGKHIHMIILNNRSKSRVINEIYNSVKNYCNKEKVNVIPINKDAKPKYLNYMSGNKSSDKEKKVEQDKKWRDENSIPIIFECI